MLFLVPVPISLLFSVVVCLYNTVALLAHPVHDRFCSMLPSSNLDFAGLVWSVPGSCALLLCKGSERVVPDTCAFCTAC